MEDFLKDASNNRQWKGKAEKILSYINKDGSTQTEYQEARNMVVKSTISQINNDIKEIDSIDVIIEGFLQNFEYNLESMRGIDTTTAANLIAEIGNIKRLPTPAKLARYAGIAPVTYSSGKTGIQFSNERGNRVLNSIFFKLFIAVTMTAGKNKKVINLFFYEYYLKKISQGKTKRQALKCVQRRLILFKLL